MINQSTLNKLSKELSMHKIIWGIGGSYLLQIYDLYSEPNDLDLWVQPCDVPIIREIFKNYEEIETDIPLPKEFHYKIKYYDVEVDFVACFIVKPNQNKFTYNILPENIRMITIGDGTKIPCTFLEDWYIVYRLLKRDDKANLIERFFREKRIPLSDEALRIALNNENNKMPKKLIKQISELIWSNFQISFFDYEDAWKDE